MKLLFLTFTMMMGCAGPTTPFGGLDFWTGDGHFFKSSPEKSSQDLDISPRRQVLHKASSLKVEYTPTSTARQDIKINVIYNHRDVTKAFERHALSSDQDGKQVVYIYPKLRLLPDRRHQIDIYIKNQGQIISQLKYLPPDCSMENPRTIASIAPFKPERNYVGKITYLANENNINPSFLAGLIAQESGFDAEMISRSKALGLTQVTSVADDELKKLRPQWHRDARIENLDSKEVASLIRQKKISAQDDWRLDPELAIEGGALYLNYLREYWNSVENKSLLQSHPDVPYSEVILASYNSGASRVKNRIQKYGPDWLDDNDLKEAFKYVNSVQSYCYHFSSEAQ